MVGEKSFLQTIKMEISRNFRLAPYERIAFHKILSLLKTENGKNILIKELEKNADIRASAVETLTHFDDPAVMDRLKELLAANITDKEKCSILNHLRQKGSARDAAFIAEFIDKNRGSTASLMVMEMAFDALKALGRGSDETRDFLLSLLDPDSAGENLRPMAIMALSAFSLISPYEDILKKNDDPCPMPYTGRCSR